MKLRGYLDLVVDSVIQLRLMGLVEFDCVAPRRPKKHKMIEHYLNKKRLKIEIDVLLM